MVVLEWQSNPVNDMFADAVLTVLLNAELEGMPWQGGCRKLLNALLNESSKKPYRSDKEVQFQ